MIFRKNNDLNDYIDDLDQAFIRAGNDVNLAYKYLDEDQINFICDETDKCLDRRYFLENYYCIRTEQGQWRTLYPWWDHQEMVYEAVEEEFSDYGYCNLIVLKPRQTGLTVWTSAAMFHRTIFMDHSYTMAIAQNPKTSGMIHAMVVNAYKSLPWWLRPESQYETKGDAIEFQRKDEMERLISPGLGSTFQTAHAQQMSGVAIGRTIRNLHCSEASRWPSPDVFHADILPSTRGAKDGFRVMESTGYGRNGLMYDWWEGSVDGDTGWRALFIPVYKVKKYYLPIKTGKTIKLTEDEEKFTARIHREQHFDIPLEFWNFRRIGMKASKYGQGKAGFLECYPITPQEAFQASGLCAFDRDKLEEQQMRNVCRPIYVGNVTLSGDDMTPNVILREVEDDEVLAKRKGNSPAEKLHVWVMPEAGKVYELGVDSALGVKGGDYSACVVWRIGVGMEPDELVASWLGHAPPGFYARAVAALGYWYNGAEIACEYQGPGISVGDKLKDLDYPALYRPQHHDRVGSTLGVHLHWLTTIKTRDQIIGTLNEALLEGSVIIHDEDLIDECIDFSSLNGGTRFEGQDNNDDECMGGMIGLYCGREGNKHIKTTAAIETARTTGNINSFGVYDNFMRLRGQYSKREPADEMVKGQPGWMVRPILICNANTLYSPIFEGNNAEREIHDMFGMHSTQIFPDVVNSYKEAMAGVGRGGGGRGNDDW